MIEKLLAAVTLLVCAALLLRLLLPRTRQRQLDGLARGLLTLPQWLVRRVKARRHAAEVIRRAKEGGEWDGNVYTPKSFKRPRKPH